MIDFNFPEGWVITNLDFVCEKIQDGNYGGDYPKSDEWTIDGVPFITGAALGKTGLLIEKLKYISEEKHAVLLKAQVTKGDVIFPNRGATDDQREGRSPFAYLLGSSYVSANINPQITLLRSNGSVNPLFLKHVICSPDFLIQFRELTKGSALAFINLTKTKGIEIPLPPLAEQQQIAQKLDELLAQVDTLKTRFDAIPKILKRFRQSVLAAAVSGRLTEEWRGSGEKWPEKKLREICLSISDGDHQAPPRADSGIPFLVISNVNKGFIDLSKVERWVPQYYFDELKDLRRPKRNDILYTVTGSFGIPVLVDTDQDFCFQRHIAILKPNADFLNYKFLFFLLGSSQAFKQADSVATGTAQRTVALNSLRDFEFGIPPLEEQTEIVRRVEQLFAYADQIEQRVKDAQARVNHLTQSILAKAFRGELTADWRAQNPELISGENSAAALLERIKAEREVAVKPKRKVKT